MTAGSQEFDDDIFLGLWRARKNFYIGVCIVSVCQKKAAIAANLS